MHQRYALLTPCALLCAGGKLAVAAAVHPRPLNSSALRLNCNRTLFQMKRTKGECVKECRAEHCAKLSVMNQYQLHKKLSHLMSMSVSTIFKSMACIWGSAACTLYSFVHLYRTGQLVTATGQPTTAATQLSLFWQVSLHAGHATAQASWA